jgi:hypothetical protein
LKLKIKTYQNIFQKSIIETVPQMEREVNSSLWFKYEGLELVLFRIKQTKTTDLIVDARNSTQINIDIHSETRITVTKIHTIVKRAINSFDDFKTISVNLTNEMKNHTNKDWTVIVGDQKSAISIDLKETIVIDIVDIRIVIYEDKRTNCKV